MSAPVFAGVDGGGTKTAIVLVNIDGGEIARHETSTSNAAVIGHDRAGTVLRVAIQAAVSQIGSDVVLERIWCGLSGGDRPEDHRLLRPFIVDLAPHIQMSNDAELVLGALPESVGIAVVSGTGSIAVGRNSEGVRQRAGGWGHIIGDEGSGCDLARRLLDAFARQADGRGPATSCTERLNQRFGLENPHQIITWVYDASTSKGDLAALAAIVMEEAGAGDEEAIGMVQDSAAELAQTVSAVAKRLGFTDHVPMALTGGMLARNPMFREAFLTSISETWDSVESQIVEDPALTAARALAREAKQGAPA